jgi:hypothetical protein
VSPHCPRSDRLPCRRPDPRPPSLQAPTPFSAAQAPCTLGEACFDARGHCRAQLGERRERVSSPREQGRRPSGGLQKGRSNCSASFEATKEYQAAHHRQPRPRKPRKSPSNNKKN